MRSFVVAAVVALGCAPSDGDYRARIVADMHDALQLDMKRFVAATLDLQNAAPATSGRGWDATQDADSIAAMRAAWVRARDSYEHMEGAIEPLFPNLDASLDSRYEEMLSNQGSYGDAYLFDNEGVVGLDAVERILYVDTTPAAVVAFEARLPGYQVAAFPATEREAADFKNALCARLVADARALLAGWTPARIDIDDAYGGLMNLVREQKLEIARATGSNVESRYSQRTMADLRANVEGVEAIYGLFRPWVIAKSGDFLDTALKTGFAGVDTVYGRVIGDALPTPPPNWNADAPSEEDLETAYGQLYQTMRDAGNPKVESSVVGTMTRAASVLGLVTP